ncbi:hypothetical protein [Halioglobus sp. HI00S01]|uniref:hypothetical protein n=1 Tax=Halioglobus sp. HI00S01 TaxID=1822214 RepID=UPI0012E79959|nr:hypothetical protein [Halioglobus sp. HI00S01]
MSRHVAKMRVSCFMEAQRRGAVSFLSGMARGAEARVYLHVEHPSRSDLDAAYIRAADSGISLDNMVAEPISLGKERAMNVISETEKAMEELMERHGIALLDRLANTAAVGEGDAGQA